MSKLSRFIPMMLILVTISLIYVLGLNHYLNYTALQKYYLGLAQWVDNHLLTSILIYCGCYIIMVAASIPGATFGTLLGGFLFGNILGTILIVFSATIGACCLFIAVRLAFGDYFRNKIGSKIRFMEQHFDENAFFYLLSLRLLPVVPFFLVNLAAALFAVPFSKFSSATLIGIIPGTFVYANIGANLNDSLFQSLANPSISSLLNPQMIIALLLLAVISIIPVIIKKMKGKKASGQKL